jgi:hypothetical protein
MGIQTPRQKVRNFCQLLLTADCAALPSKPVTDRLE